MEIVVVALIIAAILFFSFITVGVRIPSTASQVTAYDIDWNAIADEELQSYLPNKKVMAIRRYREITAASLKDAKAAVEYAIVNPDTGKHKLREARNRLSDTGGAGIRDLIASGQLDEAVRVYAEFMGVDQYTAQAAVIDLAHSMREEEEAEA